MADWETMLAEIVRTRRSALVGYAALFALNRVDGEDLVQEALVRVFAKRRSFTDAASAEAYVKAAIRTCFLDRTRRAKTAQGRAHLFLVDDVRSPEASVVAGVDVAAALATLSPRERACVVARYFDDLAVAEVAAELGLSDGAVKRYLFDATAKLRERLGDAVSFPTAESAPVAVRAVTPAVGRKGR